MKKIFKRLAAFALLGAVAVSSTGCALGELEMPEWLEQATCDHVYDEEEVLKEATCGETGKVKKTCSDCGETKTVSIPATGEHDFVCNNVDDAVCSSCDVSITEMQFTEVVDNVVVQGWYRLDEELYSLIGLNISGTVVVTSSGDFEGETIDVTVENTFDFFYFDGLKEVNINPEDESEHDELFVEKEINMQTFYRNGYFYIYIELDMLVPIEYNGDGEDLEGRIEDLSFDTVYGLEYFG